MPDDDLIGKVYLDRPETGGGTSMARMPTGLSSDPEANPLIDASQGPTP